MTKAVRWFLRLVALAAIAGLWWTLPDIMPTHSRLYAAAIVCGYVCVSDIAALLLFASLIDPAAKRTAGQMPLSRSDEAELLRRAALRFDQQKGQHHD
jgi:hypothetical protein